MATRYNTGNQVPSNTMMDLSDNVQVLDELLNKTDGTTTLRTGEIVPVIQQQVAERIDGLTATAQEAIDTSTANAAVVAEDKATVQSLANTVTTAASAKLVTTITSDDPDGTIAGLAATTDGESFYVAQGTEANIALKLYLNNSGSALAVADAVGKAAVDAINERINDDDADDLCKIHDSSNNLVYLLGPDGQIYGAGLNGKSVQEHITSLNKSTSFDSLPFITRLTDAQKHSLEFNDNDFAYRYMPGLGAKALQDHVSDMKKRIENLYQARCIFDAYTDFGIDWRGKASVTFQCQAAINYISRLPYGGEIVFRGGAYLLHDQIIAKSNVTIRMIRGARFIPLRNKPAFYYKPTSAIYLENFNCFDVEIDGSEQNAATYSAAIKGMYFQYFRKCLFIRTSIHDVGATGLGIDFPDRSFILESYTENCGRLATLGNPGASGIGIGNGAMQDEMLIIADAINLKNKNFGIFFEQQQDSNIIYTSRQAIVTNAICTGNNYGFGDCGISGVAVLGGQFNDNILEGITMDAGTLANTGTRPQPGNNGLITGAHIERNGSHGIHYDATLPPAGGGYTFSDLHISSNGGDAVRLESGTHTIKDMMFNDIDMRDNQGVGVNVLSGTWTDLDFDNIRMLRNLGSSSFSLNGTITRGSIHNCKLRSQNSANAFSGSANIQSFDISENQYTDTNSTPINLTGTLTNVTYGRNPGL